MSQRGSAPRSASHHSKSPSPSAAPSPSSNPSVQPKQHQRDGAALPAAPRDPTTVGISQTRPSATLTARTEDIESEGLSGRSAHRAPGVHGILNPSPPLKPPSATSSLKRPLSSDEPLQEQMVYGGQRSQLTGGAAEGSSEAGEEGPEGREAGRRGVAGIPFPLSPTQPFPFSNSAWTQNTGSPASFQIPAERLSFPRAQRNSSPLAPGRQILTARSPRIGRRFQPGMSPRESQQHPFPQHGMRPETVPPSGSSFTAEPSLPQLPIVTPTTLPSIPPSSSSSSSSSSGLAFSASSQFPRQPARYSQEANHASIYAANSSSTRHLYGNFTSYLPPTRAPVPLSHGGDASWSSDPLAARSSLGREMPRGESHQMQHMIAITPTHGEELLIPVDTHQASRVADEKRQRNAGASARFRQRKKEREREQQQGLQRLESLNRELDRKLKDSERRNLELEREVVRLKDVLARTPEISDLAQQASLSPRLARVGSRISEGSQRHASHPGPPPIGHSPPTHRFQQPPHSIHPPSYTAMDSLALEPRARRRRNEQGTQFISSMCGGLQPSHVGMASPGGGPGYQPKSLAASSIHPDKFPSCESCFREQRLCHGEIPCRKCRQYGLTCRLVSRKTLEEFPERIQGVLERATRAESTQPNLESPSLHQSTSAASGARSGVALPPLRMDQLSPSPSGSERPGSVPPLHQVWGSLGARNQSQSQYLYASYGRGYSGTAGWAVGPSRGPSEAGGPPR